MLNLQDKEHRPALEEIGQYVRTPVFMQFCSELKNRYKCIEKIEFSSCSWEAGWNVKFKKAGKTLCTLYPRELYFTVMIVVGEKEKNRLKQSCLNASWNCRKFTAGQKKGTDKNGS
nr:DUF3788 family protein [Anaerotruncus colihominis]